MKLTFKVKPRPLVRGELKPEAVHVIFYRRNGIQAHKVDSPLTLSITQTGVKKKTKMEQTTEQNPDGINVGQIVRFTTKSGKEITGAVNRVELSKRAKAWYCRVKSADGKQHWKRTSKATKQ